ncbi:Presequence protease 1, chloroplastic/mitochondrial [Turnera subulata]|uniref:Presequence protease 1, chloroplastic/mitochondrial n=1 Tax=Turnera subulata TaxID=218843 RepID=A0A9Q0FVR1_9ROSI|nr:Presequence protease 1, chloroplastic/mitochondrial [Turnera subulata]
MDKTFLRSLSSSSTPHHRFFLSRKASSSSSSFSSPSYYSSPVALPRHSLLRRRNVRSLDSLSSIHFHINSYNNRHFSSQLPTLAVASRPAADAVEIPTEVVEKFGFEKVSEEFIRECNSKAILFRHKKTGAQVMSVSNDDENKVFGIVFRTPPKDSTGIFHVLGRSVLLGSKKYPLTGTLPQLSKGSLHTFLNAFLYPDRTCYPVASPNTKDFYNLVDVYLDAVFCPYCVRDYLIFLKEAWHFGCKNPLEISSFRGVLINKMKRLYAQPDYILRRSSQQVLFPDNAYGFDSAGDPKVILKLTFEQFKEFHRKYYHPGNARIWFYGDDNPTERLRILSEYLDMFEASSAPIDSTIEPQKLFSKPIRIVENYPSDDGGDLKEKHMVCINWLLSDKPLDLETEITLRILGHLILRTAASPLRKVLLENELREAIIDGGIEDELLQPQFSIWLKDVAGDDIQKVEELIMNLFVKLAEEGFETDVVEASMNAIEFSLRENNTQSFPRDSSMSFLSGKTTPRSIGKLAKERFEIDGLEESMSKIEFPAGENNTESFPRGLSLMLQSIGKWIYDLNPFTPLKYEKPLTELKAKIAKEGYNAVFSPLIEKFILNNSHRVTIELQPDPLKASSDEEAEREILEKVKASMTSNDLLELRRASMKLVNQFYTDPSDVLDSVPSLSLQDLPKEPVHVPSEVGDINGVKVLQHDLFTNDFLYSEVVFDMRSLKEELLPLVPLFCESLLEMGTKDLTSVQLNQLIGRKTGGISIYPFTSSVWGQRDPCSHIIVRGKVMAGRSEDLFNMINYVLQEVQFTDQPRFKQLVSQSKARMENTLRSMGYRIAAARMNAMLNTAGWISEQMGGVSYLEYLRALEEKVDQDWVGISSSLEEIRGSLLSRNGCLVNMTADGKTLAHSEKHVSKFLDWLPSNSSVATASWINDRLAPGNEAILVPNQPKNNNYIGKAANLYDTGYQLDGSAYVISKYISHKWLSDCRYYRGGFCDFDAHSGVFSFLSNGEYKLVDALKVYDRTVDFLHQFLEDDPLTRAIIGTIRDVDAYQLPDAKGYSSLLRYLRGITEEERKRRQEEILSTSEDDFEEFASVIEAVKDEWVSVAVASPQTVESLEWDLVNYFQAKKAL